MIPQSINGQNNNEKRLDHAATVDIWDAYTTNPVLRIARKSFLDIVLQCPPEITLKSVPGKISAELDMLVEFKYRDALVHIYDWVNMFGICPYKMVRVSGTIHQYPMVPKFGSGYITTFEDKQEQQQFKWYRINRNVGFSLNGHQDEEDKQMHWWYTDPGTLPSLSGQYCSNVYTILRDYRTARILRESLEIGSWQGVRPFHVIEHHPPKTQTGDDGLTTLEMFGDEIAGMVLHQSEMLNQQKMRIRTGELMRAVSQTQRNNSTGAHTSYDYSESHGEKRERQNVALDERLLPLPHDRTYKTAAAPKLLGDLQSVIKRLDTNCAAIMDFPLEMLQPQSAGRGANAAGNARFLNERIKHWLSVFERFYKHVLLLAYGTQLQAGLDQVVKMRRTSSLTRQMQLYATTDLQVEMPCSPIADWTTLKEIHSYGLISKEDMGRHVFANYGLPMTQLKVTREPDMMPSATVAPPVPATKKRPKFAVQEEM